MELLIDSIQLKLNRRRIHFDSVKRVTAAEQFNGREGETATFLSTGLFNSELRVGGFAPRHLKRWAAIG